MTERLIAHRATQTAQWKVHWRTPTLMLCTFLAGILLALGQHFWYRFLHHRPTTSEDQKVRWVLYGRILAYLSKVAFGGCCITVFRQRIWRTFRERALSVLSIDQLFGATDDPSLFANWETVSNAPITVAIASVFWLIPLATIIFSPGALTFGDFLESTSTTRGVPHINFTQETIKDWRHPIPYVPDNNDPLTKGGNKRSVMYYNTTDKSYDPTSVNWFDYYDQPSAELRRVALLFGYNMMSHSTHRLNARLAVCGNDEGGPYNCTFTQSFVAPAYKCDLIANGTDDNDRLTELGAPFNTSALVPEGRNIYLAEVGKGDYKHPQMDNFQRGPGGLPVGEAPADLGVFKAEPVLWIGMSHNTTEPLPSDSPFRTNWTHSFQPQVFRCAMNEARYKVNWNFTGPYFMEMPTIEEYLGPVLDTNFTKNEDGTLNYDADPVPAENFIRPLPDVGLYKKVAAYHAMGDVLRDFLKGHIELEPPLPGPSYAVVASDVTKTRLVDVNSLPKKEFGMVLQTFFADLVLSLYSTPEMLVVENQDTPMNRTQWRSSFVYVPKRLWMCYAPVIAVTLIILLFGMLTIWEDGTTFSTGFSRILVTTRNTTLDDISRGACLGNDPFPMELMHTRLKFGVLSEGSENEFMGEQGFQHCAFGVASEVAPIRRGVPYAGLRKRRQQLGVVQE
jgi:hypothetical protein